jgi:hypothetical protein
MLKGPLQSSILKLVPIGLKFIWSSKKLEGILASYLWKKNGYGVMSRRQHPISKIN